MRRLRAVERTLKALANHRRLAILYYLKNSPDATVADISDHIRLSFKSTSKHLIVLATADLVIKEQRSLYAHYSLIHPLPPLARLALQELV